MFDKREYQRVYYAMNKERLNKACRDYYYKNRLLLLEKARLYDTTHRKRIGERDRLHRLSNIDFYREKDRKYYAANRKKALESVKEYYYHRGGKEYQRNRILHQKYGISDEEYKRMLKEQGGGCAICGITRDKIGRAIAVDHCHETGRVRGLLCGSCNRFIGLINEDIEIAKKLVKYLKNNHIYGKKRTA